ncbi:hypothetical protein GZH46_00564 [Fragariocoptes setiger]|uniref:Uncharacterized protein n=1 Tax=Fragariocoptes setiger TaxID=1670756 RepID=A0ABQ7SBU4_9ACAR|nr:hypothetical protein GZH46_00564 [Fragariocoptes setiger]
MTRYSFKPVTVALVLLLVLFISLESDIVSAGAAHKKPPFNGSIFGKRSMASTLGRQNERPPPVQSDSMTSQRESFADVIASTVDDYLVSATNNEMYDTLGFCEAIISNCRAWYGNMPTPPNELGTHSAGSIQRRRR